MDVLIVRQVVSPLSDGRPFSAMEGSTVHVDDADVNMVAHLRHLAALGDVCILESEEPESAGIEPTGPVLTDPSEPFEPDTREQVLYEQRTILQLRDLARERGLQTYGSKSELIARLRGNE